MFSGIIQAIVPVHAIYEKINYKTYVMIFPKNLISNIKIGSSISNNGCCLTIVEIKYNFVSFNVIYETLKRTNMDTLKIGDLINIEESMNYNDKIGGHLMTGHIDCIGKIIKIINFKKQIIMWIEIKNKLLKKYIIKHGSIGVDGVSLTINKIINNVYIRISLTPYTAIHTILGLKQIGNTVNIEVDFITKAITNTIERILLNTN